MRPKIQLAAALLRRGGPHGRNSVGSRVHARCRYSGEGALSQREKRKARLLADRAPELPPENGAASRREPTPTRKVESRSCLRGTSGPGASVSRRPPLTSADSYGEKIVASPKAICRTRVWGGSLKGTLAIPELETPSHGLRGHKPLSPGSADGGLRPEHRRPPADEIRLCGPALSRPRREVLRGPPRRRCGLRQPRMASRADRTALRRVFGWLGAFAAHADAADDPEYVPR